MTDQNYKLFPVMQRNDPWIPDKDKLCETLNFKLTFKSILHLIYMYTQHTQTVWMSDRLYYIYPGSGMWRTSKHDEVMI